MNRTDFYTLIKYSDNCWHLLGEVIESAPEVWDVSFQTTSRWNTVRLLLAHCIAAEERLVSLRLKNIAIPVAYEDRAAVDWIGIYQDQQKIRAETLRYISSLSDAEIEDETPVMPATSSRGALTRSDVLFHIFNHENYHRGQVITTLQRLGLDPPNFDYLILKDPI